MFDLKVVVIKRLCVHLSGICPSHHENINVVNGIPDYTPSLLHSETEVHVYRGIQIFIFLIQNIDFGYYLSNLYPKSMFSAKIE